MSIIKSSKTYSCAPRTFTVPEKRFSHINIDIVGPLPESCGQRYLITIIDRNTRWPEAIPIPNITTAECVQALVGGWISHFGIPEDISSDRGSQFTSALWTEIAKRIGVKTPLQRPYSGPHTVLAPVETSILVDMGGRAEQISIDRLKPAQVDPTKPVQLQQPARRGRPPALPGPPSATETNDTRGQPTA
ncbi:Pol polyprotein [Elysia marginata]|uniref:Pol polyprotein n=1 Tax=Elysia marginata TaxID=1093978 RepID=A0AAV4FBQ9_9GAST|nr:Pol polyprotein [Elysia marginata]